MIFNCPRFACLFLVFLMVIPGCVNGLTQAIPGNGVAGSQSRDVDEFSAVEIHGSLTASITIGPRAPVVIEGDENLLHRVTTQVWDGRLIIAIESDEPIQPTRPISVKITTPAWNAIEVQGDVRVSALSAETETLTVEAHGTSSVRLTGVKAKTLKLEGQGAAKIEASGQTNALAIVLEGASGARLEQLDTAEATVQVSGASSAAIQARTSVVGTLSGASLLRVSGPALHRAVNTSGASRLIYTTEAPRLGTIAP